MKLAFSTLGVPGLPLADVLRLATTYGYHGVELRAHPEEPVHPGVGLAERADAVAEFKAAGVEVLGLAGYARVAAPGDDEPVVEEIHRLLDLARDLGSRLRAGLPRRRLRPVPRGRRRHGRPAPRDGRGVRR